MGTLSQRQRLSHLPKVTEPHAAKPAAGRMCCLGSRLPAAVGLVLRGQLAPLAVSGYGANG